MTIDRDNARALIAEARKAVLAEIHGQDPRRSYSVAEVKSLVYSLVNASDALEAALTPPQPMPTIDTDAPIPYSGNGSQYWVDTTPPQPLSLDRDALATVIRQAFRENEWVVPPSVGFAAADAVIAHLGLAAKSYDEQEAAAEFDRWLAQHDAETAAKAWDKCLDEIEHYELNTKQARAGNPYRTQQEGAE